MKKSAIPNTSEALLNPKDCSMHPINVYAAVATSMIVEKNGNLSTNT